MSMKQRENSFSYLRAIASIAIVCLHTCYVSARIYEGQVSASQFIASRSAVNLLMWAVPCFVMVSGALLLDPKREITYKKLFGSYIFRMAGALIICCPVFQIIDLLMEGTPITASGILTGFQELFTASSWSHLWYLYLMIGLYLLMPFYKKAAAASSEKDLLYLLTVYGIFLSLIPLFTSVTGVTLGFYVHVSTIYPFYLFAGYYIYHYGREKLTLSWSLVLLVAATAAILILSILKYSNGLFETEDLWGYSSPIVIVQAIGMYGLFLNVSKHVKPGFGKVLEELDKNSFGIYLTHMIFVRTAIRAMQINPYGGMAVLKFIAMIACITVISYVLTKILRMIPVLKRIF